MTAATTLRDIMFNEWSLTGELSKTGTEIAPENVNFFDRLQVDKNQLSKAVIIQKINPEGNENVTAHPKFNEIFDLYELTVHFRVTSTEPDGFSDAIDKIEQMGEEVVRILKTVYDPSIPEGVYFKVSRNWTNEDYRKGQIELRRKLRFQLTTITSDEPEVFSGFGGVLSFDVSGSQGDNLPGSDYIYTEAYNIQSAYGTPQIEEPITGTKIPAYFTGIFQGRINADMYLKSSDIGTGTHQINNIGREFENGETAEIILLQQYKNTDSETLTITTKIKVISITPEGFVENLVKLSLVGEVIEYPGMVVA